MEEPEDFYTKSHDNMIKFNYCLEEVYMDNSISAKEKINKSATCNVYFKLFLENGIKYLNSK